MNAPNRVAAVVAVVEQHRDLFGTDDTRRHLLPLICAELNKTDGGEWGLLRKTDRDNFIPSDIIVFRSTMEHFDVLLGDPDRAGWIPNGVIANPAWEWISALLVDPTPQPAPPEIPPDDVHELFEICGQLIAAVAQTTEALLAVNARLLELKEGGLRVHF